jgi:hypothetical protein
MSALLKLAKGSQTPLPYLSLLGVSVDVTIRLKSGEEKEVASELKVSILVWFMAFC